MAFIITLTTSKIILTASTVTLTASASHLNPLQWLSRPLQALSRPLKQSRSLYNLSYGLRNHSHSLWSEAKRTMFAFILSRSKRKRSFVLEKVNYRSETNSISIQLVKIETKTISPKYSQIENETNCLSLNFWRSKRKRPDCSKILEEQSESKGISPTFSESMVKRIGVFQKFVKTKQNEVKLFKILLDRRNTNIFFSNFVEEEKQKNQASFFLLKKTKKNEYNRS